MSQVEFASMYIKNGFQSMKKFYFHLHFHLKKQYRKSLLNLQVFPDLWFSYIPV